MGALDALGMAETPGAVTSMGKTALVTGGELLGWASTTGALAITRNADALLAGVGEATMALDELATTKMTTTMVAIAMNAPPTTAMMTIERVDIPAVGPEPIVMGIAVALMV